MGGLTLSRICRASFVLAAVAVGVVAVLFVHLAWSVRTARGESSRGTRALQAERFVSASAAYRSAALHLRKGDRSLQILTSGLGWIPVVSPNLRLARLDVRAARAVTSTAGALSAVAAESRGAGILDLAPLLERKAALAAITAGLDADLQRLRAAPVRSLYGPLVRGRKTVLSAGGPLLRSVSAALALTALATPGRTYLLILQNPAELRATGGLIGAWGLLHSDGTLRLGRFSPDTELPRPRFAVKAPTDYLARYGRFYANGAWVNANMSPDFPTSARVLLGLYRSATGLRLDGVVGIDAVTLEFLVEALGTVRVGGRRLVPGTFLRTVLVDAYARSRGGERANLLVSAGRAGWRRLPKADPLAVASALADAAARGHVRLFAVDPEAQALFASSGLAGRVARPPGDYLLVVAQNAGGNKLDYYLHTRLVDRVLLDKRGNARSRLAIELRNAAPRRGLAAYAAGLIGPGEVRGTNHTFLSVYATSHSEMLAFRAGSERTAESSYELGHPVFSWFQKTPPQGLRTAALTLQSPGVARRRGRLWTYRLLLQSQPQLNPPSLTVTVGLPAGARIHAVAGPHPRIAGAEVRFRTVLDHDQSLAVTYCFCPKED